MLPEPPFPEAYSDELRNLLLMCEIVGYTVVWTDPTWHVMHMPGQSWYLEASNNVHGASFLARQLESRNDVSRARYSFGPASVKVEMTVGTAVTVPGEMYSSVSFPKAVSIAGRIVDGARSAITVFARKL